MTVETGKETIILLLYDEPKLAKIRKVTRTYIEKMLFLLKEEAGFAISDYTFKSDDYGPCAGEMYDDLELLSDLNIIRTQQGPLDIIDKLDDEIHEQSANEFEQALEIKIKKTLYYDLTKTGKKVAAKLYKELNEDEKSRLNYVKHEFGSFPLRDIIRYIYNKYPELTDKSKIRKKILFPIASKRKLARFRRG